MRSRIAYKIRQIAAFFRHTQTPMALALDSLKIKRSPFVAVSRDGLKLALLPRNVVCRRAAVDATEGNITLAVAAKTALASAHIRGGFPILSSETVPCLTLARVFADSGSIESTS